MKDIFLNAAHELAAQILRDAGRHIETPVTIPMKNAQEWGQERRSRDRRTREWASRVERLTGAIGA
jgi:hypothetical protein